MSDTPKESGRANFGPEMAPQLLYATGRVSLFVRMISLPFLGLCSWVLIGTVSYLVTGDDLGINLKEPHEFGLRTVAGILALALLVALFVGVWFWQYWIYVDPTTRELIFKHRGILGISWRRLNSADATYIAIQPTGVLSRGWDILLVYADGRTERLTRISVGRIAQEVTNRIAAAIDKPVRMPESARKAAMK